MFRMIDYATVLTQRIQAVHALRRSASSSIFWRRCRTPSPWASVSRISSLPGTSATRASTLSGEGPHQIHPATRALPELRRQIAVYLNRRFGLQLRSARARSLSPWAAVRAIDLALRCCIEPGDEVIIPTPSFVCYGPLTSMSLGTPVFVETKAENEFRLTAEELKAAITPKTKALVLPYPCNPTGGIMERARSGGHRRGAARAPNILVISDEIYAELTYGDEHHVSIADIPGMYERTIVVNGFSKAYSMTGWRMGYLCGPRELVSQMHQAPPVRHHVRSHHEPVRRH